ncbi:hypothetical protein BN136_2288 [Cronobacter universalis NCTC 9529]|nr:hypothetical protein BN136_2288 [Cronobacter universalis NCTC 9529]
MEFLAFHIVTFLVLNRVVGFRARRPDEGSRRPHDPSGGVAECRQAVFMMR